MKVSSVGYMPKFRAKAVSNTTLGTHRTRFNNGLSQEEIIEHYDKQIEKIEAQKQRALELDDFMHSTEAAEALEKLPKEDEVEIDSLLKTNAGINGVDTLEPRKMMLYYVPKTRQNDAKIYLYDSNKNRYRKYGEPVSNHVNKIVQNEDGSINKELIIDWLNEIAEILK